MLVLLVLLKMPQTQDSARHVRCILAVPAARTAFLRAGANVFEK